jgi:hypothetical protein
MPATARSTRRVRRICTALAAAAALFLLSVPLAAAASESYSAKRVAGKTAVFRVAGLSASNVRKARLRVGGYRARVSSAKVRRAARRGTLRLRLPRKVARRLRGRGARLSRRSRRWPRLTVTTVAGPTPHGSPVAESLGSFETGDFSEFSDLQVKSGGQMDVIGDHAYDGSKSARARWLGGTTGAQRVWQDTDWRKGSEVWYGMAVYVPSSNDYCYWNPMRWDNYDLYGGVDDNKPGTGDVGGLTVEQNRIYVMKGTYGGEETKLVEGGQLPKGRWVWLELHQVFSDQDGQALSELYIDGAKKGSSTRANSNGRPITDLRAGAVAVADECSSPSAIDFDRVSISNSQRGPLR